MIVIVFVIAILEKLLDLRSACADAGLRALTCCFFLFEKSHLSRFHTIWDKRVWHICPGSVVSVEKPGQKAVANRDYCGVL